MAWISVYKDQPLPGERVRAQFKGMEIIALKRTHDYWQLPNGMTTKDIFLWQRLTDEA